MASALSACLSDFVWAIEKDGEVFPDGAVGDQIRKVIGIMDGPISKAFHLGAATVELELWRVNTQYISKVYKNSRKGQGHQNATYHIPSFAHELGKGNGIPCSHLCQHLRQGCQDYDYDASTHQHHLPENGRADYYQKWQVLMTAY